MKISANLSNGPWGEPNSGSNAPQLQGAAGRAYHGFKEFDAIQECLLSSYRSVRLRQVGLSRAHRQPAQWPLPLVLDSDFQIDPPHGSCFRKKLHNTGRSILMTTS